MSAASPSDGEVRIYTTAGEVSHPFQDDSRRSRNPSGDTEKLESEYIRQLHHGTRPDIYFSGQSGLFIHKLKIRDQRPDSTRNETYYAVTWLPANSEANVPDQRDVDREDKPQADDNDLVTRRANAIEQFERSLTRVLDKPRWTANEPSENGDLLGVPATVGQSHLKKLAHYVKDPDSLSETVPDPLQQAAEVWRNTAVPEHLRTPVVHPNEIASPLGETTLVPYAHPNDREYRLGMQVPEYRHALNLLIEFLDHEATIIIGNEFDPDNFETGCICIEYGNVADQRLDGETAARLDGIDLSQKQLAVRREVLQDIFTHTRHSEGQRGWSLLPIVLDAYQYLGSERTDGGTVPSSHATQEECDSDIFADGQEETGETVRTMLDDSISSLPENQQPRLVARLAEDVAGLLPVIVDQGVDRTLDELSESLGFDLQPLAEVRTVFENENDSSLLPSILSSYFQFVSGVLPSSEDQTDTAIDPELANRLYSRLLLALWERNQGGDAHHDGAGQTEASQTAGTSDQAMASPLNPELRAGLITELVGKTRQQGELPTWSRLLPAPAIVSLPLVGGKPIPFGDYITKPLLVYRQRKEAFFDWLDPDDYTTTSERLLQEQNEDQIGQEPTSVPLATRAAAETNHRTRLLASLLSPYDLHIISSIVPRLLGFLFFIGLGAGAGVVVGAFQSQRIRSLVWAGYTQLPLQGSLVGSPAKMLLTGTATVGILLAVVSFVYYILMDRFWWQ